MQGRKKTVPKAAPAAGTTDRLDRSWLKPLPLQQEFESLRRFAEGYGLTAEKLAMMARSLERYPAGEKKGVLESLRSLAEKRRIPHGRLTRLAEAMAYEPELLRQIESVKNGPPEPRRRPQKTARKGLRRVSASAKKATTRGKSPIKVQCQPGPKDKLRK